MRVYELIEKLRGADGYLDPLLPVSITICAKANGSIVEADIDKVSLSQRGTRVVLFGTEDE